MATTSNTYTGNGTNKLFSITFPYLETSDINVYLNGVLQTITTHFSFANATTVEFVAAPSAGVAVLLDRSTDDTALQATFFPGSSIKANDLNFNFDQVLYLSQETANLAQNQSTAGLQTQITAVNNTSNTALTTANAATVTANSALSTVSGLSGANLNRIINGNCQIDQRAVVATTNDAYFTDRWQVSTSTTGAYQCSQSSDAPTGFTNSLVFDVTTADTSIAASEFAIIQQHIEGSSISDLSWGSASAQTVTLSFSVKSTTTGTYCVALRNSANNRSYVAAYSVVSANTWERKTITISGDTSGTWLTTNGRGISVSFSFAAGSTYQTTAGSWQAGNFLGTSSQTNLLALTSNEIRVTGVQLEPGPVATLFERRPIGTELALCQRYYEKSYELGTTPGGAATAGAHWFTSLGSTANVLSSVLFSVKKRTSPTVNIWDTAGNANKASSGDASLVISTNNTQAVIVQYSGDSGIVFRQSNPISGAITVGYQWVASSEL